jgi:hypothetical protein
VAGGLLPRIELLLILLMMAGFVLIAQQWSFALYQLGLLTVIGATILNIAVGNVPRTAQGWRALRSVVVILAVTAAVFVIGILLVPYLAELGQ